MNLAFALNYFVGGLHPAGYHIFNIATHIAAALLVFGIIRRTILSSEAVRRVVSASAATPFAFMCAALWLIHPLQTEVVDYITQRTEGMAGLFVLAAIYAALRAWASSHRAIWSAAAIAACAAGLACKESAATAPILILLYDVAFRGQAVGKLFRRRWRLYAGLAVTWLAFGQLLTSRFGSNAAGFGGGIGPIDYLMNQVTMIATYLKLTIVPHPLILDYGPALPHALPTIPDALMLSAALVLAAAAWRRSRPLAFLGAWFFIGLAPSSSVVPVFTEVGAERRMYLPLLAVVVLAIAVIHATLQRRLPKHATAAMAIVVCCLAAPLAWLTWQRNAVYRDPILLWESVVEARPQCRAHVNLGVLLKDAGRRGEAINHFQAALPGCPEAHYSLGLEAETDRHFDQAERHYREYIRLRFNAIDSARAHKLLGRLLRRQRRAAEAEFEFRTALQIVPDDADAQAGLGDALFDESRWEAAADAYRRALALKPTNAMARSNLALALVRQGRAHDALPEFQMVVTITPDDVKAHRNLATALMSLNRAQEGIDEYRRAIQLREDDAGAHAGIAMALASQGQVSEALSEFRRALELNPGDTSLREAYSDLLARHHP